MSHYYSQSLRIVSFQFVNLQTTKLQELLKYENNLTPISDKSFNEFLKLKKNWGCQFN